MLCAQGPVRSPVELSMEPEFRHGHGSVYDALSSLLPTVSRIPRTGHRLCLAQVGACHILHFAGSGWTLSGSW